MTEDEERLLNMLKSLGYFNIEFHSPFYLVNEGQRSTAEWGVHMYSHYGESPFPVCMYSYETVADCIIRQLPFRDDPHNRNRWFEVYIPDNDAPVSVVIP